MDGDGCADVDEVELCWFDIGDLIVDPNPLPFLSSALTTSQQPFALILLQLRLRIFKLGKVVEVKRETRPELPHPVSEIDNSTKFINLPHLAIASTHLLPSHFSSSGS